MMRRGLSLLGLLIAIMAIGVKPAQACPPIPGVKELCELAGGNSLLSAVASRIDIYVETMLQRLKIESTKDYSETLSMLEQRGARSSAIRDGQRDRRPAIPGVRCSLPAAYAVAMRGSQRTPPSMQNPATAVPEAMRSAAVKQADAAATHSVYVPLPSPTDANGEPQPVGAGLGGNGSDAYDPESYRRGLVSSIEKVRNDRRQNKPASSSDQFRDAANRYAYRMNNYGPDQTSKEFIDADISAITIFSHDVYPSTETNNGKRDYQVGNKKVTQLQANTMYDAAQDFCTQLVDPTVLGPNRGQALGDDLARKGYAVQRAGWDARLSLASTICSNIVAMRAPRSMKNDGAQGLLKIAMDYRKSACDAKAKLQNIDFLKCTGATTSSDPAVASKDADVYGAQFSEYELMKMLYSSLLPSLQGAGLIGAASGTDTLGNILNVDHFMLSLNYKIYEMQEQLNLIKAAQLAQQVENTKTSPNASAPSR